MPTETQPRMPRMLLKALRALPIVMAVLVIALSVGGIVGAWYANRAATKVTLKVLTVVETGTNVAEAGIGRVEALIQDGRTEVRQADQTIRQVAGHLRENAPVLAALVQRLETELGPNVNDLREKLAPVVRGLETFANIVEIANAFPAVREKAPNVVRLNEVLRKARQLVADVRQLIDTLRAASGPTGQVAGSLSAEAVAILTGITTRIDVVLERVLSEVQDAAGEVRAFRDRAQARTSRALLFINSIFERTWGNRAGQCPATEYWVDVISATKRAFPDFLFMAEAYWDKEWELQQQGFDYCYDKRLYDRLEHSSAEDVRLHLCADLPYLTKLVRFIENHDEPRALAAFSLPKQRAAAVLIATIPGARLFHEGQFEGRKVRLPVFLARRPEEPAVPELQAFYTTLLKTVAQEDLKNGSWRLCERSGWPDNGSYRNLVAWCWRSAAKRNLAVVNLSDASAQGQVRLPWEDLANANWSMRDAFSGQTLARSGNEMLSPGLYVDLAPWGFHILTGWRPAAE